MRPTGIILDYCAAAFEASPVLRQLIAGRTPEALELTNGNGIEVGPACFRKLRGPTYINRPLFPIRPDINGPAAQRDWRLPAGFSGSGRLCIWPINSRQTSNST